MQIRYMSDLHLEFSGRDGTEQFVVPHRSKDANSVLVLAGDIDVDKHAVALARRSASRFRAVIQVAGNHEYYKNGSPLRLPAKLAAALKEETNVHFLEDSIVEIEDVRFIGSTLWTDFNDGDPAAMLEASMFMNDFKRIRYGTSAAPYARKFSPMMARALHTRARDFLFEQITDTHARGMKAVVVTHHAPRLPEGLDGSLLSFAYGSDLEALIRKTRPHLWIHGHLHESQDYRIGTTRVVCNPRGYVPQEPNAGFDPSTTIEI